MIPNVASYYYHLDKKSFEFPSPSELDRKFFGEQSLLSALSLEQLSTSRASNDMVSDGSDARLSVLVSLCQSADTLSPLQTFSVNSLSFQESQTSQLAVPLQGKSSTPHPLLQNHKWHDSSDEFYSDVMASQVSWDVSVIKPENNSPKPSMDLSVSESNLSPKPQLTPSSLSTIPTHLTMGDE
ncbi:hypothetical protein LDENG_00054020 [Lucifuga dentata]|nr:hypothetical protein LDENG_00054020 [Lucifuga dentata]